MTFRNSKIEIWKKNNTTHCITVKSARIAHRLNVVLKSFPLDTKFHNGEEPTFQVNLKDPAQIESIKLTSGYMKKILVQMGL